MKLSMNDKLKIAKQHVEDGVNLHQLAKKYDYYVTNIKHQCRLYELYGEKAFENHGTREEKLKAIDSEGVFGFNRIFFIKKI